MEEKIYTCECGKTFTKPNNFNGHKSHCQIHLGEDRYKEITVNREIGCKKAGQKTIDYYKYKKAIQADLWTTKQHTCERCGKIMTEKFGSGRFCNRSCANSRLKTVETKIKLSKNYKRSEKDYLYKKLLKERNEKNYLLNPNFCKICGKILSYKNRNHHTCSKECLNKHYKNNAFNNKLGGLQNITSWGKRGTYKGIHCDSRYELIYLIYCIDHNINIQRPNDYFFYEYEGKIHKYFPDFYLVDSDTYVELRGYDKNPEITNRKLEAVRTQKHNICILYEKDLKFYVDYIKATYNLTYQKVQTLYDAI